MSGFIHADCESWKHLFCMSGERDLAISWVKSLFYVILFPVRLFVLLNPEDLDKFLLFCFKEEKAFVRNVYTTAAAVSVLEGGKEEKRMDRWKAEKGKRGVLL